MIQDNPRSKVEAIKDASRRLRGTILEGLADTSTGALADDDTQLTKFHGIYQQDDRDLRTERRKQKLEKAFIFMVRLRIPGGIVRPDQWIKLDSIADEHANGTLKITTRQTFQYHGVIKAQLKPTMQGINQALIDTIAACGDVNRNVMCNPNPHQSEVHAATYEDAVRISEHLLPKTRAYHEIWLDGEKVADSGSEEEPIYGDHYLPRKFKTVIAVPPSNDVDLFAHDLGYIAIVEDGALMGYNVTVGGGMGMSHNNAETFPRLAEVLGYIPRGLALQAAEAVVKVQRDYGDRAERKHARLKYTIEDRGLDWFRREVESYGGFTFEPARPYHFDSQGDRYGWVQGPDGKWHFTLYIMSGRIKDEGGLGYKSALREIAGFHTGDFRLTANQNLIIASVAETDKARIEEVFARHGIDRVNTATGVRLSAMSCVALPTCGLALAESERYLPGLVEDLEAIVESCGLRDDAITVRVTGCPNGCARPYLAEIGLVGRAPRKYNLYLGAKPDGTRLNKLYKESLNEEEIIAELRPLIERYARERNEAEPFGDWVIRAGIIAETTAGNNFHQNTGPNGSS